MIATLRRITGSNSALEYAIGVRVRPAGLLLTHRLDLVVQSGQPIEPVGHPRARHSTSLNAGVAEVLEREAGKVVEGGGRTGLSSRLAVRRLTRVAVLKPVRQVEG